MMESRKQLMQALLLDVITIENAKKLNLVRIGE